MLPASRNSRSQPVVLALTPDAGLAIFDVAAEDEMTAGKLLRSKAEAVIAIPATVGTQIRTETFLL